MNRIISVCVCVCVCARARVRVRVCGNLLSKDLMLFESIN